MAEGRWGFGIFGLEVWGVDSVGFGASPKSGSRVSAWVLGFGEKGLGGFKAQRLGLVLFGDVIPRSRPSSTPRPSSPLSKVSKMCAVLTSSPTRPHPKP